MSGQSEPACAHDSWNPSAARQPLAGDSGGLHVSHSLRKQLHACMRAGGGLGAGGGYFIVMEHLDFRGRPSQRELGRGLARMHLADPSVRALP